MHKLWLATGNQVGITPFEKQLQKLDAKLKNHCLLNDDIVLSEFYNYRILQISLPKGLASSLQQLSAALRVVASHGRQQQ